jgi:septum site-determining protein MinC
MSTPIAIKGIGDKLVVSVPNGDWKVVLPDLIQALDERGDFFKGAKVSLQLEDRELGTDDLIGLKQALSDRGIALRALMSTNEDTRAKASEIGLQIEEDPPHTRINAEEIPFDSDLLGEDAILVDRTLRSGQRLYHPGHVIVLGDANPGSEIVAGGHIVIWGRLRGTVHAGAAGNEDATVCALDLVPTQLRIAGHIAVSPKRRGRPRPEIVRVQEGQLVAEPWDGGGDH